MARIGPATFEMGTAESEIPDLMMRYDVGRSEVFMSEVPQLSRVIAAIEMDRYEVTNSRYLAFVEARPEWRPGRVPATMHYGHVMSSLHESHGTTLSDEDLDALPRPGRK